MKFHETTIPGVMTIEPARMTDDRGWFARTFCAEQFEANGLNPRLVQCNISFNEKRGTLRGMHYQAAPHGEDKLIRVTRGAIFDVALDLREGSPTFRQWQGFELSAERLTMLYLPQGIAHGFLTLTDHAELFYQMSHAYHAESSVGVRWNDPAIGIEWPAEPVVMSDRDRSYPDVAS